MLLSSCNNITCSGNKQLWNNNSLVYFRSQFIRKSQNRASVSLVPPVLNILVYSVWVGDVPLLSDQLNHKKYCEIYGYPYRHYYFNLTSFFQKYGNVAPAWASVLTAKDLLDTAEYAYFYKMDVDCLFARTDLRIESAIDPLEQYSFYITNTSPGMRFMQSQSWILKTDDFSKNFVNEWLQYMHWGKCGDLAAEQGALQLVLGSFYERDVLWKNKTQFTCRSACKCFKSCDPLMTYILISPTSQCITGNSKRNSFGHHMCVINWFEDNGFGENGTMDHPFIYVYPFQGMSAMNQRYKSPDDGFFSQVPPAKNDSLYDPFTVHPCKKQIYAAPAEVRSNLSLCKHNWWKVSMKRLNLTSYRFWEGEWR